MKRKTASDVRLTALRVGAALLALGMIGAGLARRETSVVFEKAVRLCLECIGIA